MNSDDTAIIEINNDDPANYSLVANQPVDIQLLPLFRPLSFQYLPKISTLRKKRKQIIQ